MSPSSARRAAHQEPPVVRTRADARLVIDGPIQLFCRASGSLVQPSKSQGLNICVIKQVAGLFLTG